MTITPLPPKEVSLVVMLVSTFKSGKCGKRNKYVNKGLRGRNVKTGVFRFKRSDGKPFKDNCITAQVQVSEPWCNEKVWSAHIYCTKHVLNCEAHDDDDPCDIVSEPVEVGKYLVLIGLRKSFVEVELFECKGTEKKPADFRPANGVGFTVCVMLRSDKKVSERKVVRVPRDVA